MVLPGDTVVVPDGLNARIDVYTSSGDVLDALPWPVGSGAPTAWAATDRLICRSFSADWDGLIALQPDGAQDSLYRFVYPSLVEAMGIEAGHSASRSTPPTVAWNGSYYCPAHGSRSRPQTGKRSGSCGRRGRRRPAFRPRSPKGSSWPYRTRFPRSPRDVELPVRARLLLSRGGSLFGVTQGDLGEDKVVRIALRRSE